MRILFLTQYYPPETGAAQNRLSDLARRLTRAGHRVTVLTALPSYPKGEIYDGYRGRLTMREDYEGICVVRTWVYVTKRKSFVQRILNYLSFAVLSPIVGWVIVKNVDVIIVESPPLFLGVSGYLLSRLKRAKFVLNVSDLWPESAVALDVLRNRRLIRWAKRVEEWLYNRANLVTGQTQGIVDSIQRRCTSTPVHLLTNGVALEFLEQVAQARISRMRLRVKFGFAQKFIVAYTGLHGLAQGLDTLLRSAELLKEHADIQFCFFGEGPEKPNLQSIAAERGLGNVRFYLPLPAAEMAELLASVDVSIVPLKRNYLFKGALPSKLFEALGAGVPVLVALDGEAKELIEKSRGGLLVAPENPEDMAQKILQLYQDAELCRQLGENGREYVRAHYSREEIAKGFEHLILIANSPTSAAITTGPNEDNSCVEAHNLPATTPLSDLETSKEQR
jgi:glycosyltransferase involved in cell wall biosynthesis